jgi:hypothetical protein
MNYRELSTEELADEIVRRAAEWPEAYAFAWYLLTEESGEFDGCACQTEAIRDGGIPYGLNTPDSLALGDEASAGCFFKHGSPELVLAIGTGSRPWIASEVLCRALKMSEEGYLAGLGSPPGSEVREQFVARLREALPRVIHSLRTNARKLEAAYG